MGNYQRGISGSAAVLCKPGHDIRHSFTRRMRGDAMSVLLFVDLQSDRSGASNQLIVIKSMRRLPAPPEITLSPYQESSLLRYLHNEQNGNHQDHWTQLFGTISIRMKK